MDLTFDLQLGRFVSTAGARDTLLTLSAKRGDNFPIRITFCRGLVVTELAAGATGVLGLKVKEDHAGNFVASASSWTLHGSGTSAYYEFSFNLSTTALDTLLGVGTTEEESVELAMELQFIEDTQVSSSNTVLFTVLNDYVRNTESGPTIVEDGAPVNQVLASLETSLTGSNNDLRFVSKLPGASGNDLSIRYKVTTNISETLAVAVSSTQAAEAATGTVEVSGCSNGDTVTIGAITYTKIATGPSSSNQFVDQSTLETNINAFHPLVSISSGILIARTAGTAGNSIALSKTGGATISGSTLSGGLDAATLSGPRITVTLAKTFGSVTTTAAQAKTAIEADSTANALVTVTNKSGNDGTGTLTALSASSLSGGITATPGFIGSQRVDGTYFYWVSAVTSGVPTWLRADGSSF